MTAETYFRRAAFLPIVVPIVVGATAIGLDLILGGSAPPWFSKMADVLLASLLYFGPLYLALAVAALRLLRGKPAWAYCTTAVIAPVVMLVAIGLASETYGRSFGTHPIGASMAFWSRFLLPIGYSYCAIAALGFLVCKRMRWITDPQ